MGRISSKEGSNIWLNLLYHDDGVDHYGGNTCSLIGKMGSGKSTLIVQIAEYTRFCQHCSKEDYIDYMYGDPDRDFHVIPQGFEETVIWRGRKYDYWNCLIPRNWNKSFPRYAFNAKNVILHKHVDDDLSFYHKVAGQEYNVPMLPEIYEYEKASDLFKNIEQGAINIVYEPQVYMLPPTLIKRLKAKRMESKTKEQYEDESVDVDYIQVPPPVFWFEFVDHLLDKKGDEFYSLMMDEFHQVCPSNALGDMWHLIDWFAASFLDIRKNNVSLYVSTHSTTLVDWRILDRMGHFIWLPGSRTSRKNSMVYPHVITKLTKGQGIIEEAVKKFGIFNFSRINKQPPLVRVNGMSNIL